MTLKELSELYYLDKHIERLNIRIAALESRALPKSPDTSGMPRAPSPPIKLDELVPEIADEKTKLERLKSEYQTKKQELESRIYTVPDEYIKLIMLYRFVDLLTWQQIAQRIGGDNTEDSVRKACNRYIRKHSEK